MKSKMHAFFKSLFGSPIPAGPLSAKVNNLSQLSDGFFWLRADPVRLEADHQRVFMRGYIEEPLEQSDIDKILNQINALLKEHNSELIYLSPKEWLLKIHQSSIQMPSITNNSPDACLHQDIRDFLPTGEGQAYWRCFFTECQMIMQPYANNSLWFWGAGVSQ